jgi:MFS family permease
MNAAWIQQRLPALASRNFRIFWVGQFISLIGTWMQSTTTPYLAYRLSSQPFLLGLIGFAATLPTIFIMLPAGVIIERLDKRRTVIILQVVMMLQAFVMAYLALSGKIAIWHMIVLSFILGTASSLEINARQAMLIELSGRAALPNAIALNATIFNAARILGPSLAAPFLVFLQDNGEGWAFFTNGVSYLFVILSLFVINTHSPVIARSAKPNIVQDFLTGQRFIRRTRTVLVLILMATIPGFLGFPLIQQVPVFAREVLKTAGDTAADVAARNSLMLTFVGVGALISALFLALASTTMRRKGVVLVVGQVLFSLALIGLSFSRSIEAAAPMMVMLGLGMPLQMALTNTLIQLIVPDELRGRVLSTYLWALQGVAPFGSLFIGWFVQGNGAAAAALLSGTVCLLSLMLIHLIFPAIRKIAV